MIRVALIIAGVAVAAPAMSRTPIGNEERVCAALGIIAESSYEAMQRGVPLQSAQAIMDLRARDHNTSDERRQMIRRSVEHGYSARSARHAHDLGVSRCGR